VDDEIATAGEAKQEVFAPAGDVLNALPGQGADKLGR